MLLPLGGCRRRPSSGGLAEEILKVSDLAHTSILAGALDVDVQMGRFDVFRQACETRLEGKKTGREIVGEMNVLFFDDWKFAPVPDDDRIGHLFLDSVLERQAGPCLALSGLYLAVAERLRLPFFGVMVPGHFFVRYDDGRERINVELLKKGASMPDDWYRERYRVPPGSSCYLRNLSPKETLAPFHFNLGNAYRKRRRLDEAKTAYERAIELLPGFSEAHGNLGVVHMKKGAVDRAVAEFKSAIGANPLLTGAYLDLGAAYRALGRSGEEAAAYRKGLAVAPGNAPLAAALKGLTATTGSE